MPFFRFVFVDFVLLSLVSFYFVFISLISLISFRFVSFSLISFRFVSFLFRFALYMFPKTQHILCQIEKTPIADGIQLQVNFYIGKLGS